MSGNAHSDVRSSCMCIQSSMAGCMELPSPGQTPGTDRATHTVMQP